MSDYVGTITGVIGAITGTAGAIMGCRAYRRTNKIKALDLRLELRRELSDAHALVRSIGTLLDEADRSRQAMMAAVGLGGSGAMTVWGQALIENRKRIKQILTVLRPEKHDFKDYSAEQLESELVSLHGSKRDLEALDAKYRAAMAEDDARRCDRRKEFIDRANIMDARR